jgi:hypothetical protein
MLPAVATAANLLPSLELAMEYQSREPAAVCSVQVAPESMEV